MSEAEISDKKLVESLKGDTESMVFLNSLFSATVGSFIIEIYKTLLPDNNQRTVDLLSQLVSQSSSTPSPAPAPIIPSTQPFTPPRVAVHINIILFLSFFLSIMSAVGCSLIQQWCHEYLKYAYPRAAPYESGRVRTYLFQGLDQFQLRRFMYGTHVLLHISVFLFFVALSDFFCTVHPLFGNVTRYCLVAASVIYMALSISPLISGNSPYSTPLTPPLRACGVLLIYAFRIISRHLRRDYGQPFTLARQYFKGIRFDRAQFLIFKSEVLAAKLEPYAMEWLFTEDDFSDNDMDRYLEGLPGYLSSHHTKGDQLDTYLMDDYILKRIKDHFVTCATSPELSEEASILAYSVASGPFGSYSNTAFPGSSSMKYLPGGTRRNYSYKGGLIKNSSMISRLYATAAWWTQ
ncbi:hypothetical protein BC826DRAFT_534677 [Russula brevipes]|nr:hypothetical protein BC826DRAFT_534677 [Russula brevipes]